MGTLSREKFIIISANTSCLDVNINSETIRGWFVNSVVAGVLFVGSFTAFEWAFESFCLGSSFHVLTEGSLKRV